jgi:hypothetical protein
MLARPPASQPIRAWVPAHKQSYNCYKLYNFLEFRILEFSSFAQPQSKSLLLLYSKFLYEIFFFLKAGHLVKEFRDEEPRDGAGPGGKADDEEDDHRNGQVSQDRD